MAPRPETFRRNVILLVSAACVVRIGIWVASSRTVERLGESAIRAERGQRLVGALESVRSGLQTVVALERGYVITGRESDLRELAKARRMALQNLAVLLDLAREEPGQRSLAAELTPLVDRRFAAAEVTVEARRAAGFDAARERVLAGRGAPEMDEVLAKIDAARAKQLALLGERAGSQRAEIARILGRISGLAVFSILVLIAAAAWLIPSFDERVAVRDRLRPGA